MCDINVSVIKKFKRFFVIVFFMMVFALLSLGTLVHAESNGVCGTALNWTLTDEGKLTITGNGDMYDYDETTFWNRTSVKRVEMPEGLTSIGKSTFMACTSLSEVNIPSNVTSIGDRAFMACTNLSEIAIPSKVTSVGSFAFNNCANLTNVTISEGVTSIGDGAFHSCRKLSAITVPASVTIMGLNVFKDCENLEFVLLPVALKDSVSRKSLDISENTKIYFYDGKCGDDLAWTLTDDGELTIVGVGNMYDYDETTFWDCAKVKKVGFKESVNSIGNSVFKGCAGLSAISIPASVTSVGASAFGDCTNLKFLLLPKTLNQTVSRQSIGVDEKTNIYFYDGKCGDDLAWTLTDEGELTIMGTGNMYDYDKTKFWDNAKVKKVKFKEIVSSIGKSVFEGCTGLTSITIPSSVSGIGDSAFEGCTGLTKVTVPDSVSSIGKSAFTQCSNLASLKLPFTLKKTRESLGILNGTKLYFYGKCSDNIDWTLTDKGVLTIYGEGEFSFLDNPEAIRFWGDSKVKKVEIKKGITNICDAAFSGCSDLSEVIIPDSVTSIGNSAFSSCVSLSAVTIPSSVVSIDKGAFAGCSSLTKLDIPDSVKSIGDSVFDSCRNLTKLVIPESVISIGNSAFSSCVSLSAVTLPSSITSIGNWMFRGCTSLDEITIPSGVTSIGKSAFERCTSLTKMTVPASVTSIGDSAFKDCTKLKLLLLPERFYDTKFNIPENTVVCYVDRGTTSTKINKKGIVWLKKESDKSSTWYGLDNSQDQFTESRFWVCGKVGEGFSMGVEDNPTDKMTKFPLKVYIQVGKGSAWKDANEVKDVFSDCIADGENSFDIKHNFIFPDGLDSGVVKVTITKFPSLDADLNSEYTGQNFADEINASDETVAETNEGSSDVLTTSKYTSSDSKSGSAGDFYISKTSDTIMLQTLFLCMSLLILALVGLWVSLRKSFSVFSYT